MPGVEASDAHGPAVEGRHADLAALQVSARPEHVGHLGAVRRDGGVALVAVLLEGAVRDGERSRPGVVRVHHGQPRSVVALDADHDPPVRGPHRARALHQVARRSARHGREPHVTVVRVGHRLPVGREPRVHVLPVGLRVAAGRQTLRRAGRLEVEQPHVRGLGILDHHRAAPVGSDGERARSRRARHRLESPVRRRLQVLARLGEHPLVLVLADPDRSLSHALPPRFPRAPRARGARSRSGHIRPPAQPRSAGRERPAYGPPP